MFETPVKSIGDLDEYEFEAIIRVCEGETWEYYEDDGPTPDWVIDWCKSLGVIPIYSLGELDPVYASLGIIWDDREKACWFYCQYPDNTLLKDRVPVAREGLTPEILWPFILSELNDIGDSILFGEFTINAPSLIAKRDLKAYMEELMKANQMERLVGGTGPTLEQWLEAQFKD